MTTMSVIAKKKENFWSKTGLKRLREILRYDPETGVFSWNSERNPGGSGGRRLPGATATTAPRDNGYLMISFDGSRYYAHQLAFLFMTGEWPVNQVDHINGVRTDNRWSNLRDVTHTENVHNRHKALGSTGVVGVHYVERTGRYRARIQRGDKVNHLGYFDTLEEARRAYQEAK